MWIYCDFCIPSRRWNWNLPVVQSLPKCYLQLWSQPVKPVLLPLSLIKMVVQMVLRQIVPKVLAQRSLQTCKLSTTAAFHKMFFTKKHEYVNVEGDIGTVGISNYAQEALGDIVYAQLPQPDDSVVKGEDCGALESVKAASDVFSPVTGLLMNFQLLLSKNIFFHILGTVTAKNEAVENAPSLINTSAMEEGWLFKVKLAKPEEVDELMDQAAYDTYLKEHEESD